LSTDVAIRNEGPSPWASYAQEQEATAIAGDLLKFTKGKWTRGENKTPIKREDRFLANMMEMWVGWVRWENGKPAQYAIVRLADGQRPPMRNDLGYLEESTWEKDDRGYPKDPWAMTDRIILRDTNGELLTYSASSAGGRKALGKLCKAYDQNRSQHEGEYPVVVLRADSYEHASYGEVLVPVFEIVEWDAWDDSANFQPKVEAQKAINYKQDLDDEIPF
jgi:hypothetical protein